MFTIGRVKNRWGKENRSSIFFCIHLLSKAMYHCNCAPHGDTNIALFFTGIFKLKLIDWNATFVPSSLTTVCDSIILASSGLNHLIFHWKKKFKIAGSKTAIPSCCRSSSFPQRNLLFWAALKEGKAPEHNWASRQASESSHPTWVTENYLLPSKQLCCSEGGKRKKKKKKKKGFFRVFPVLASLKEKEKKKQKSHSPGLQHLRSTGCPLKPVLATSPDTARCAPGPAAALGSPARTAAGTGKAGKGRQTDRKGKTQPTNQATRGRKGRRKERDDKERGDGEREERGKRKKEGKIKGGRR